MPKLFGTPNTAAQVLGLTQASMSCHVETEETHSFREVHKLSRNIFDYSVKLYNSTEIFDNVVSSYKVYPIHAHIGISRILLSSERLANM